jgi:hypothetical protein
LENIKHGFKTLAECRGIRGVDNFTHLVNFYFEEELGNYKVDLFALKLLLIFGGWTHSLCEYAISNENYLLH